MLGPNAKAKALRLLAIAGLLSTVLVHQACSKLGDSKGKSGALVDDSVLRAGMVPYFNNFQEPDDNTAAIVDSVALPATSTYASTPSVPSPAGPPPAGSGNTPDPAGALSGVRAEDCPGFAALKASIFAERDKALQKITDVDNYFAGLAAAGKWAQCEQRACRKQVGSEWHDIDLGAPESPRREPCDDLHTSMDTIYALADILSGEGQGYQYIACARYGMNCEFTYLCTISGDCNLNTLEKLCPRVNEFGNDVKGSYIEAQNWAHMALNRPTGVTDYTGAPYIPSFAQGGFKAQCP